VFTRVNTVVNAFHLRALTLMARLAEALGQESDAKTYLASEVAAQKAFQERLFNPATGLYRDGEGTEHNSAHANLFPLAFGLVPDDRAVYIAQWLAHRGMKCSVYAAQYLLEGLFEQGEATRAIELMTAPGNRSWEHMVDSGTTITWEAWDQRYKPNQDWNHAWGAAPANLLPRYVLGLQPLEAGWKRVLVAPNPGPLTWADGKVPSPLGSVHVRWELGKAFKLSLELPPGMVAQVQLPLLANSKAISVNVNGRFVGARRNGRLWTLGKDVSGTNVIEAR